VMPCRISTAGVVRRLCDLSGIKENFKLVAAMLHQVAIIKEFYTIF
jgi:hypothetical protein